MPLLLRSEHNLDATTKEGRYPRQIILSLIALQGSYWTWLYAPAGVHVVGGDDIGGIEYDYFIDVHEIPRVLLSSLLRIRSQREIVWPGCQAIRKVLQEESSMKQTTKHSSTDQQRLAGNETISERHKESVVYVRQRVDY